MLVESSPAAASVSDTSDWTLKSLFSSIKLPSSGIGLFIVSTIGLTIVGTSTHFIWTRLYNRGSSSEEEDDWSEEELLRLYQEKKNQRLRNDIPQPLIMFDELFDRARYLSMQRSC